MYVGKIINNNNYRLGKNNTRIWGKIAALPRSRGLTHQRLNIIVPGEILRIRHWTGEALNLRRKDQIFLDWGRLI